MLHTQVNLTLPYLTLPHLTSPHLISSQSHLISSHLILMPPSEVCVAVSWNVKQWTQKCILIRSNLFDGAQHHCTKFQTDLWNPSTELWRRSKRSGTGADVRNGHGGRGHYSDVIMSAMASQITGVSIICSTVGTDGDQRNNQSSASLAFVGEFAVDRWLPRTKGQ